MFRATIMNTGLYVVHFDKLEDELENLEGLMKSGDNVIIVTDENMELIEEIADALDLSIIMID